jgi:MFS superfamily sulfate permease-like transporter
MLVRIFPFIKWFAGYNLNSLRIDLVAGLTVALVLIPQSMAYAQLAGLPAYYGLYAAFLPPMIAALFGSSRQLATGPVAIVSLMTAASLETLATAGSPGFIAYAIVLALMIGFFQFLLGVLKLGLVVNFLSHPVVNGFTNAAAIIIASSQLSKLFGVYVDSSPHHYETIWHVLEAAVHYTHWPTLLMGALAFGIMYSLKTIAPRVPNVLVAVVITTLLSWGLGFEHNQTARQADIISPKAQSIMEQFNGASAEVAELSKQRTRLMVELNTARQAHNSVAVVDIGHDVDVVNIKMQQAKDEAHHAREALRYLHFVAVPQANGNLLFYQKENLPNGSVTDGRTWRIRVGNGALPQDRIVMTGGGAVVGNIPKGLPAFSVPAINLKVIVHLFPFAVIISLLGFMEAISIAKAMAGKTGQRLDPNQELIGQGLANMVGAIGQSYPVSGSFSRSAVNLQAGAVSGMSSVFTGLTVLVALMFFTPFLYHLPQSVLAAVIMMAVVGLINVSGFIHAWRAKRYDGAISVITFCATLVFAPHLDKGIMIGVVLSLAVFIYKSMRPRVVSLARAHDYALRCVSTHGLQECDHISMVRFDGPLFFANSSYLEDKMMEIMRAKPDLRHIILVCNGINDIDASGEETLSLLIDRIRSAGLDISLSGVNEAVMKVLKRTHLPEKIGEDHIFPTMEKAISIVHPLSHRNNREEACPLLTACPLPMK